MTVGAVCDIDRLANWVAHAHPAFRACLDDFGTRLYAGHDWVNKHICQPSMELTVIKVAPRIDAAVCGEAAE